MTDYSALRDRHKKDAQEAERKAKEAKANGKQSLAESYEKTARYEWEHANNARDLIGS